MNARLLALKAQAAALRSWADALDAQVAEAEAKAALEHVYESAKLALLALPDDILARTATGEPLVRCSKGGCLRTSRAPWRFRAPNGQWSAAKPACSAH